MDKEFLSKLKLLENECSFELYITSGYRCDTFNKEIGGDLNSRHLEGLAVDIRIYDYDNIDEIKALCERSNYFTRVYDEGDHIHIGSGDFNFAFRELKDSEQFFNDELWLSNSLYISRGADNNTSDFYRIGYFLTDGYDLDNFYLYYEKLIGNFGSELNLNQNAIGASWSIYSDGPYWGLDLSLGKGKLKDNLYFFIEPNINIGYLFQYIDLQFNIGYTLTTPWNLNKFEKNDIRGFNFSICSNFGIFKS